MNPFKRLCLLEPIQCPRKVETPLKRIGTDLLAQLRAEVKERADLAADNRFESRPFPQRRTNPHDT